MWHIPFNTREYIDFGGVITIAVKVWSWKLVFGAAFRGSVNQNIERDYQATLGSAMF